MQYEIPIENWDFRDCYPGAPAYDAGLDLFLSGHYVEVVAVEAQRLEIIARLLDAEVASVADDGRAVLLKPAAAVYLAGMKAGQSRWTRNGRWVRRVINSMGREMKKYGSLRPTLRPNSEDVHRGLAPYTQTDADG